MINHETVLLNEAPAKILSLDWHDGPTVGLAEYAGGSGVFQFRLVSNPAEEPRFYALSASPLRSLSDLEGELLALGKPKRPIWAPTWKFSSEVEQARAEQAIARATPPSDPFAIVSAESMGTRPLSWCRLRDQSHLAAFLELSTGLASAEDWNAFVRRCSLED